ncbi:MAG: Sua5/YciO/YrdC/YwlC family protein [Paludibacter sp.]|nr:Sua5/YciO/YrdC/YwlC family protein [Paludibacter sp.]
MQNKELQKDDINHALQVLKAGGIVVIPTDTDWCFACDATNTHAVEKFVSIIGKNEYNILLLDNVSRLTAYLEEFPDIVWDLFDLSEKPLTLILGDAKNISPAVLSDKGTVGFQITNENFSKNLCSRFRNPLMISSLNKSPKLQNYTIEQIHEDVLAKAEYVVKSQQGRIVGGQKSSVISIGKGNVFRIICE